MIHIYILFILRNMISMNSFYSISSNLHPVSMYLFCPKGVQTLCFDYISILIKDFSNISVFVDVFASGLHNTFLNRKYIQFI